MLYTPMLGRDTLLLQLPAIGPLMSIVPTEPAVSFEPRGRALACLALAPGLLALALGLSLPLALAFAEGVDGKVSGLIRPEPRQMQIMSMIPLT